MAYLEIRVFTYLKTPKWKWTFYNASGGSFSNSGEFTSLKACLNHAKAMITLTEGMLLKIRTIEGYDKNDMPIETCLDTIVHLNY